MYRIIHIVSNTVWGGGEQYVYDLCQHLKTDGYNICIVCRPIQQVADRLQTLGIPITFMPLKGMLDLLSAWRLSRILKQGNIIVHTHNFRDAITVALAMVLSDNKKRVRLIVTRHLVKKGKDNCIYKWLYKQINQLIFVSELAKREFLLGTSSMDSQKINVIHNSIRPRPNDDYVDVYKEFSIDENIPILMYFGRIAKEKGLSVLIEALPLMQEQNYVLLLFGTGNTAYTANLKKRVYAYGLSKKVIFAGFRPYVLPYIRQCIFGIVPSVVCESFSLSCLEYMSQGKCMIATNNGGQTEYLETGKNAVLVSPNDPNQLAASIDYLLQHRELCIKLGMHAKQDYEDHLSYEHFYQKIKSIYLLS